jgi:uncharacterized protein YecT (DUF1311 family)
MNTTSLLRVAGTLLLASCIATAAHADAPLDSGLDRLMGGTYCADCTATECAQVELTVANELLDAQLRQAAGGLRIGADGDRAVESLYAAQAAWERYRDLQCTLLVMHEAQDTEEQDALRGRCRLGFTVERILDLAEMQERIEASVQRLVQLY